MGLFLKGIKPISEINLVKSKNNISMQIFPLFIYRFFFF